MIHLAPRAAGLFEGLAFDEFFALGRELAKASADGRRRTSAFERGGRRFYVKTHGGAGPWELLKNWLQLKRPVVDASTEARALLRGEALGLPVPRLVAWGAHGWNPASRRSFIVTEALPLSRRLSLTLAQELALGPGRRRALVRAAAALVRALHAAPLAHRDLYLEHLFLAEGPEPDGPRLYLLDLHRSAPPARARRAFVKDLAALAGSARHQGMTRADMLRFLAHYATDLGRPARHALFRSVARRLGRR